MKAPAPGRTGEPSASSGAVVEWAILVIFSILRLCATIQTAASAIGYGVKEELPLGSLIMSVVAVVWSVFFLVGSTRRGSFAAIPQSWGIIDIAVCVLCLVVTGLVLPRQWLVGSWHGWAYSYTALVSSTIPGWLRSRNKDIGVAVGIAAIYLTTALPGNLDSFMTPATNSISYVVFITCGAIMCPAARRLAATSDENRERALKLTAQLEQAKYQFHIHNVTGLMAQLIRDDTPQEIVPLLREQASQEVNRLRHDILSSEVASTKTVDQVVNASLSGFGDLPIEARTALGRDVPLNPDEALVLESALISLLYNVQFHANATEVVVHADSGEDFWEVSVCDNGVGFDPGTTSYGFGLQSQVLDSAHAKGMTVEIMTHPGEGTCVVIRGRKHSDA